MNEAVNVLSGLNVEYGKTFLDNLVSHKNEDFETLEKVLIKNDNSCNESMLSSTNNQKSTLSSTNNQISQYFNIPVLPKKEKKTTQSFQQLQEWEGCISRVRKDHFTAVLIDVTADQQEPDEEADFDMDAIDQDDLHLVTEGAIFRWVIGYYGSSRGKQKASLIVFRKISRWTEWDLLKSNKKANDFRNIVWE